MQVYFDYDTAQPVSGQDGALKLVKAGEPFELSEDQADRVGVFENGVCVSGDPNLHVYEADAAARAALAAHPVEEVVPAPAVEASAQAAAAASPEKPSSKSKSAAGASDQASAADAATVTPGPSSDAPASPGS